MKNLNLSKTKIATIILSILLISSIYVVIASAEIGGTNRTTKNLQARVDPATGQPYGNLTQYEWISAGNGGENTRYGGGPAPNSPTELFRLNVGSGASLPTVFNGKLFCYSGSTIKAYDPYTGALIFTTAMNGSAQGTTNGDIVKYNDELFGYFATNGAVWYNMTTGQQLGKTVFSPDSGATEFTALGAGGSAKYWGRMYDYESKTFIGVTVSTLTGKALAVAVDCSDLLNQGAPVKWVVTLETGDEAMCFGDGKAFFGGYGEPLLYAIDIATGQIVWTQTKAGNFGYSATYYDGVLYHCASSTQITAIDGATGAVLKIFDVKGGRAFYAYGGAAAYGMYFDSSIQIPQGWTSAWNAKTLTQLWKQPSEFTIKYLVGSVGDGKFFTCTCDVNKGSPLPGGASISDGYRFTAFDCFTGQEVWNLATPNGTVVEPTIAYGNLYISVGSYLYCYSDVATSADGTTGWPFFDGPTTSAGTATGEYPSDITKQLWNFQADGPITGSPVVVDGYAYFGSYRSHQGTLYCVDVNTAAAKWTFAVQARILSTPAVVKGIVYTGADDGNFYALNATTGAIIWTYATIGGVKQGPLQFAALQLNPSPIVYNDRVICGANDGYLYCINAKNGNGIWVDQVSNLRNGIAATAAIVPNDLLNRTKVLLIANSTLHSINFATGAFISQDTLILRNREGVNTTYPMVQVGKPNVVGDLVFVSMGTGVYAELRIYNATTMIKLSTTMMDQGSGSTPGFPSPAYIPSYTVVVQNGTNLGWGTSDAQKFIVNGTTTKTFNVVIATEAQVVSGWALIPNGTNLGGTTQATRWIVNSSSAYYLVRLWFNWVGHQVFGNPVVAINAQTPGINAIVYEGNSVYGFTAFNCTDGAVLSTYTADAQVFSTPALYQNRVYMTDSAGFLHCFANTDPQFAVPTAEIYANSNKGTDMLANEAMVIEGRLTAHQIFYSPLLSSPEDFHPALPSATVSLAFVNPDGSSSTLTAVTDANGKFNFTVTPTQVGKAQWLAYFDGMQTLNGEFMGSAYTSYSTVNVLSSNPTTSPSETTTSTPTPIDNSLYIYAIVGIIVALVVVIAIVMLLRRKK